MNAIQRPLINTLVNVIIINASVNHLLLLLGFLNVISIFIVLHIACEPFEGVKHENGEAEIKTESPSNSKTSNFLKQ